MNDSDRPKWDSKWKDSRRLHPPVSLARRYVQHETWTFGQTWLIVGHLNPILRQYPRRRIVRARFGARFAVDTQDLIQRYIYMFGVWEPHMTRWLQSRLRPGDTFVDVGANIGYYSILASRLVGDEGRVVALEASPAFHQQLLKQVRLNEGRNVRAV